MAWGSDPGEALALSSSRGCGHVGNPVGVVHAAMGNTGNPEGCPRCVSTGVVHGRVMSMPHP